jgi:hypothetical protein
VLELVIEILTTVLEAKRRDFAPRFHRANGTLSAKLQPTS